MSRRSSIQPPSCERHWGSMPQRPPLLGRVRFPSLTWKRIVGLGLLAWVLVYRADGVTRTPGQIDPSLLGKHPDLVESVAFHPGGRWLASAGGARSVSLWDIRIHELTSALEPAPDSGATSMHAWLSRLTGLSSLQVTMMDQSAFGMLNPRIFCAIFAPACGQYAVWRARPTADCWRLGVRTTASCSGTSRRCASGRHYSEVAGRSTVSRFRPTATHWPLPAPMGR